MNSLYTKCDRVIEILKNNNDMKHKVCLLFTFLSLSVSGISATNGQDSIRQIQLSDLEVQIRWVNPTAIRAYLDDTKTALGGKAPALYEKLSRLETLLPGVRQAFSDKVSSNATDEVIGQAQEILALKREIILPTRCWTWTRS